MMIDVFDVCQRKTTVCYPVLSPTPKYPSPKPKKIPWYRNKSQAFADAVTQIDPNPVSDAQIPKQTVPTMLSKYLYKARCRIFFRPDSKGRKKENNGNPSPEKTFFCGDGLVMVVSKRRIRTRIPFFVTRTSREGRRNDAFFLVFFFFLVKRATSAAVLCCSSSTLGGGERVWVH
jgi:hypothetical protein